MHDVQSTAFEELTMFIDTPLYDTNTPVMYVAAVSSSKKSLPNKLGVCDEYNTNSSHAVDPMFDAKAYFLEYKKGPAVVAWDGVQLRIQMDTMIEVATPPNHGSLTRYQPDAEADDSSKYEFAYTPDKGYEDGLDNFEFVVSRNGKTLHVYYQVKVFPEDMNPKDGDHCNWEKSHWKISSTTTEQQSLPANFRAVVQVKHNTAKDII